MGKAELVTLLKAQLNASVLVFRGKKAAFDVVPWYQEGNMIKDCLQNGKLDLLFSVKAASSTASRFLGQYRVPKTDVASFEVGVWLVDSPSYAKSEKDTLRDAAVGEIKRVLKAYPSYGREEACRTVDNAKGNLWILCSVVTVTKKTESN